MLILVSQGTTRFLHQGGGYTNQYAPVGWGFVKICKSRQIPTLAWGGGGSGFQLISALSVDISAEVRIMYLAGHTGKQVAADTISKEFAWQKHRYNTGMSRMQNIDGTLIRKADMTKTK